MPVDPKQHLRDAVRAAQDRYEASLADAKKDRQEAFREAQAAGMSLREIGEVVNLHTSRIGQIIDGK